MLMSDSHLFAFVLASAAIIVAPGPAQALVLARTLSGGRRAGVLTAVGLNVGTIVHATAAGLGLSAILATSAAAFSVVKYLGAAYLLYLGIFAIRGAGTRPPDACSSAAGGTIRRAIVTGILNPKVAVFFLAFLPQFVHPAAGPIFIQCLLLGTLLAAMDIAYESGLAWVAGAATKWLAAPAVTAWRERITGGVLIGLGVRLALTERD